MAALRRCTATKERGGEGRCSEQDKPRSADDQRQSRAGTVKRGYKHKLPDSSSQKSQSYARLSSYRHDWQAFARPHAWVMTAVAHAVCNRRQRPFDSDEILQHGSGRCTLLSGWPRLELGNIRNDMSEPSRAIVHPALSLETLPQLPLVYPFRRWCPDLPRSTWSVWLWVVLLVCFY